MEPCHDHYRASFPGPRVSTFGTASIGPHRLKGRWAWGSEDAFLVLSKGGFCCFVRMQDFSFLVHEVTTSFGGFEAVSDPPFSVMTVVTQPYSFDSGVKFNTISWGLLPLVEPPVTKVEIGGTNFIADTWRSTCRSNWTFYGQPIAFVRLEAIASRLEAIAPSLAVVPVRLADRCST